MEENSFPYTKLQTMASKFVMNFFGGSTVVRVVRPNLINWEKKTSKHLQFSVHADLILDILGKYYLLIPFKNFPRDAYPRPLLDGPLSVDNKMLAMSSFSIKDNSISLVSGT